MNLQKITGALFALVLFSSTGFSQNNNFIDSLVNEICISVQKNNFMEDSTRIIAAYRAHRNALPENLSQEEAQKLNNKIYFRLQKFCPEFNDILERLNPNNGDWKIHNEKPVSKLNGEKIRKQFSKEKKFIYLEHSGDPVHLTIDKGLWIDSFKDGTYSKLSFKWTSQSEFEIIFIESDNRLRKNFSNPGDKYSYGIIDFNQQEKWYLLFVKTQEDDKYYTFKLYY